MSTEDVVELVKKSAPDYIMGNFWHIGEIEKFEVPKEAYEDGVSMLFVNSERGKQFFEKIQHAIFPKTTNEK